MEKMIFVLGANRYDFEDEKTGKQIRGVKLHYVDYGAEGDNENINGLIPSTETIEYSRFYEIEGPGFYIVTLGYDLSGRKPKVVFERLRLVQPMDFNDYVGAYNASA